MFRGLVFAGLLALAPSFAWAQQPCSTDARHVVDELYRHMLERTADAGSQGWVARLNQGMTVRELVRQIAQSPEHLQRFVNPSEGANANRNAVGTMYRHIFGDWGVPGSGGLVYCGNSNQSASTAAAAPAQMRFAELDRNHNGIIERNEWRGSARQFAIHDWNGDNVLSGDEVRIGATPPPNSLEAEDYNMSATDRFS